MNEEEVLMLCVLGKKIDNYLTDNEISPKPVLILINQPQIYFEQLVELAPHWEREERLAVGSMVAGQPLKAQGATDVQFVYADREPKDPGVDDSPIYLKPLNDSDNAFLVLVIFGNWSAEVNRPAREAAARAKGRGINVEETWPILYMTLRSIAEEGFFVSLNELCRRFNIGEEAKADLFELDRTMRKNIISTLREFEGLEGFSDRELSPSDLREQEQHRAWDDE